MNMQVMTGKGGAKEYLQTLFELMKISYTWRNIRNAFRMNWIRVHTYWEDGRLYKDYYL
jgi:hypothetical protein